MEEQAPTAEQSREDASSLPSVSRDDPLPPPIPPPPLFNPSRMENHVVLLEDATWPFGGFGSHEIEIIEQTGGQKHVVETVTVTKGAETGERLHIPRNRGLGVIGIIKRKALIKDLAAVYHAECLTYCKQLLELQRKREEPFIDFKARNNIKETTRPAKRLKRTR